MDIPTMRVMAMCGVKERTLYRWLKAGVIAGVAPRVEGSKYPPFSPRHVTFVRLAAALRRHHFGLDDIRDALRVLDVGWDGKPPGQLFADRLGWTFAQQFLVQVNGKVQPLVAAPPVLFDVGRILAGILVELDDLEASHEVDDGPA